MHHDYVSDWPLVLVVLEIGEFGHSLNASLVLCYQRNPVMTYLVAYEFKECRILSRSTLCDIEMLIDEVMDCFLLSGIRQ